MAFRVRIESFEGPFDLLLYLVSRQKVDIGSISIAEITDQYLEEVSRMENLDLDVASDFLLVASTLLEIKAASLIPAPDADTVEEIEELAPNEARDILVDRLVAYKQFKNAAAALGRRGEAEGRLHVRLSGPDASLMTLVPDYLEDKTLEDIARLCCDVLSRRDPFLLESDHIAAHAIPVEEYVRSIHARIKTEGHVMFSQLLEESPTAPLIVVAFLAVLELYKRGMVRASQNEPFGDIQIDFIEGSGEYFVDAQPSEVIDAQPSESERQ